MHATTASSFFGELPPRAFEVRLGSGRRSRTDHMVYMRRRLLVGLVLFALLTVLGLSVRSVLADHGGVPASTPVVQPASAASPVAGVEPPGATSTSISAALGVAYLVQPGDTLWTIAERWRGSDSLADYVQTLVDANGGASIEAGQLLTLP